MIDLGKQFEAASRAYTTAAGIERDRDWFMLKIQEEVGELTQIWNTMTGRGRQRGMDVNTLRDRLADETADVLGHVFLFALANEIDLASAIERKWRFRPNVSF